MNEKKDILLATQKNTLQNIQAVFNEESQSKQLTIQLKLCNQAVCELNVDLDILDKPNKNLNKLIGVTLEEVLNRLLPINTVQNK